MRRAALGLSTAALALLSLLTPGAAAEVSVSATALPPQVVFPAVREVTYRVELRTGSSSEELIINEDPPSWATRRDVRPSLPARHTASNLEGPGELIVGALAAVSVPYQPRAGLVLQCDDRPHSGLTITSQRLRLPAHSTSVLVARWELSRRPPFSFTDYRPRLTLIGDGAARAISLPKPQIVGPVGVPMRLLRDGPGRVGRTQRLRGRTDPALAGQVIVLRLFGPVSARARTIVPRTQQFRTLARVRVDRLGHFDFRWRPRRGGLYGAYPAYLGQSPDRLRDRGCPVLLKVR